MIPKVIHYCWFSRDPYPEKIDACIASWKKFCPEFELRLWHDIDDLVKTYPFVGEAYKARKWAFVTDFVRLYALCTEGGFYLDTDVELLGSLSPFAADAAFCGTEVIQISGKNLTINPEPAIMGAAAENPLLSECLDLYKTRHFDSGWGRFAETPMPAVIAPVFERYGYVHEDAAQCLRGGVMKVYPSEVFTNVTYMRDHVVALHRITHSWKNDGGRVYSFCRKHDLMPLYVFYKRIKGMFLNFFS